MEPSDLSCVAPLDTEAFSIESAVSTGPMLGNVYTNAFGTDPARWAELSRSRTSVRRPYPTSSS